MSSGICCGHWSQVLCVGIGGVVDTVLKLSHNSTCGSWYMRIIRGISFAVTSWQNQNVEPETNDHNICRWHPGSGVGQSHNVAVRDSTFHLVKLISNVNTDINNLFYRFFLYGENLLILERCSTLALTWL
jgi:hypothetical protein